MSIHLPSNVTVFLTVTRLCRTIRENLFINCINLSVVEKTTYIVISNLHVEMCRMNKDYTVTTIFFFSFDKTVYVTKSFTEYINTLNVFMSIKGKITKNKRNYHKLSSHQENVGTST